AAMSSSTEVCRRSRLRLSPWSRSKPGPVPAAAVSAAAAPTATSPARTGGLWAVPDAREGRHDRTPVTARAELLPQPVHVLGDRRLALPALGAAPHVLQQLGSGEHLPGMPDQEREQVEFL